MTEDEEFEFRLRLEQEQTQQTPQSASKKTFPGEGVLRGLYDPFTGVAQGAYNLLPKGVQQYGDRLNNRLADLGLPLPRIPEPSLSSLVSGKPTGFNAAIAESEADYQKRRGGGSIDAQRIAGNVFSPINAVLALKAPQAVGLAQRAAQGAGVGSAQAMTQPVTQGDYLAEKLRQGKTGAVVGGALPVVAGGVARAISPRASVNPDIALLRRHGVEPTIGQALGGIPNKVEQKLTSALGVGDSIATARHNAQTQFNRAVLNDTVESVGGRVDGVGREGVRQAGDMVSRAYDDALQGLRGVTLDRNAITQMNNLQAMSRNLSDANQRQFDRVMRNVLGSRLSPNNGMAAETFKIVDSDLGKIASNVTDNELKNAFREAQGILRETASRQNPEYARALRNADLAYAKLVRTEDAAKRSVVGDGQFTPAQFLGSVKSNAALVRGRDFSRGTALGQQLGEAGQRVLGNTVPDSGTAGRMMPLLQGGAAVADLGLTAGLTGGGMAAYTPAVQRALVNALSRRGPSAPFTAEEVRKLAPLLNPLAIGLMNGGP